MTRDDVIRLAREADISKDQFGAWLAMTEDLERFAALVIKESQRVSTSQQLAQKTQENVHVIDGADWPEPDSGFAKLEAL